MSNGNISHDFLYKYRSSDSEYLFDTISEAFHKNRLWFSALEDQNDEYEAEPLYVRSSVLEVRRYLRDELNTKAYLKENGIGRNHPFYKIARDSFPTLENARRIIKLFPATIAEVVRSLGIYSLSGTYESTKMWGHYGGGGRGVCLEFRRNKDSNEVRTPIRIEYRDKRPSFTTLDTLRLCNVSSVISRTFDGEKLEELKPYYQILFRKSESWEYEKEYRIMGRGSSGYEENTSVILSGLVFGAKADNSFIDMYVNEYKDLIPIYKLRKKNDNTFSYTKHRI